MFARGIWLVTVLAVLPTNGIAMEDETPYVGVRLDRGPSGSQGVAPIVIRADMGVAALAFAVDDIQQALAKQGDRGEILDRTDRSERSGQNTIVIGLADDEALLQRLQAAGGTSPDTRSAEGYAVRVTRQGESVTVWALGADVTGAMYAGLAVAETIAHSGFAGVQKTDAKPYVRKRGLKINAPLDARTPAYADCGDAAQQNMAVMWDLDFWKAHLDQMARHRYNTITLWNQHPFPSMVRVPDYPEVALEDVKIADIDWRAWFPKNAGYGGSRGVTPDILENLKILKTMSMDEKIAHWRAVMQHARDRGIEFYIITWNIFTWAAEGTYGITHDVTNEVTVDYLRQSVRALFETYPLLARRGSSGTATTGRDNSWCRLNTASQIRPQRLMPLPPSRRSRVNPPRACSNGTGRGGTSTIRRASSAWMTPGWRVSTGSRSTNSARAPAGAGRSWTPWGPGSSRIPPGRTAGST